MGGGWFEAKRADFRPGGLNWVLGGLIWGLDGQRGGGTDGRTEGRKDVRTSRNSPLCSTGHHFSTFRLYHLYGRTNGRTDGRTDKASYRVSCPQLKKGWRNIFSLLTSLHLNRSLSAHGYWFYALNIVSSLFLFLMCYKLLRFSLLWLLFLTWPHWK